MKIARIIFYVYVILLVFCVILKFNGSFYTLQWTISTIKQNREMGIWNVNLVPLSGILQQLELVSGMWAFKNLVGNTVAFVPWGFLLPAAHQRFRRVLPFALITVAVFLIIESCQLVFMIGYFDVDDIILNSLGAFLGYLLWIVLLKKRL